MSAGRRHRPLVPIALAFVLTATLYAAPVGAAGATPTLRLFVTSTQITVERNRHDFVFIDPGAWVTPVTDDFELWVSRPDYETPITIKQVDADTKAVLRTISADNLEGWFGLKDFAHYEVVDAKGNILLGETIPYCPNSWQRQRLSDESPLASRYPYSCGAGFAAPFTKGSIWGLELGWATPIVDGDYHGLGWKADRRNYTVRFSIDPAWVELLSITPSDATAQIRVTVVDRGTLAAGVADEARAPSAPSYEPYPRVPVVTGPDPDALPDLLSTPAYSMETYSRRGHDYLGFAATEWNAGPGTMVVEGFRGTDDESMDAFQYFILNGRAVGKAPIGELEFHAGGGHNHWHFEEFTRYSLLDPGSSEVVVSGKQSWCLVNTDALDLTLPNANVLGYGQDLGTSCGGPGALWIREVLDVGWGDTYTQFQRGQAFDITDLPNGRYFVRVHVNPTGSMLESDTTNNVEDRLIRLRGTPGHRRVVVPLWHGIDTEHTCYYCG
jgi:Lysyl oxidase